MPQRPQISALVIRYSDGSETTIETDQHTLQWELDIEHEIFDETNPYAGDQFKRYVSTGRMKLRLVVTGWPLRAAHKATEATSPGELVSGNPELPPAPPQLEPKRDRTP